MVISIQPAAAGLGMISLCAILHQHAAFYHRCILLFMEFKAIFVINGLVEGNLHLEKGNILMQMEFYDIKQ